MPADLDMVRRVVTAAGNLAVIATTRPDGTVHATLVSAGLCEDPITAEPSVAMVVRGDATKLRHLRRAGRGAAIFQSGWTWASVEGPVRIAGPHDATGEIPPTEIPALLRRVFVAAGGTHEDWPEFDRVMAAEHRTAVFIKATRLMGNG